MTLVRQRCMEMCSSIRRRRIRAVHSQLQAFAADWPGLFVMSAVSSGWWGDLAASHHHTVILQYDVPEDRAQS
jgi:hypothetical protein